MFSRTSIYPVGLPPVRRSFRRRTRLVVDMIRHADPNLPLILYVGWITIGSDIPERTFGSKDSVYHCMVQIQRYTVRYHLLVISQRSTFTSETRRRDYIKWRSVASEKSEHPTSLWYQTPRGKIPTHLGPPVMAYSLKRQVNTSGRRSWAIILNGVVGSNSHGRTSISVSCGSYNAFSTIQDFQSGSSV